MTVIRKREGDKGGCCNPYSELQLEIERVDQTAIDAKTTANNAEATINANIGKVNEAIAIVPQVQTNTENIAVHQGWLSANTTDINKNASKLKEQEKDITALKTKTNDNAAAIEALENEVGPETVAGTIQYRLKDIDTKLPTAIKEVEMIADASTVTHKATHISGTAESDALPVVSREQAGIMSASVYAAMEDVIANNTSRISVLEQSALTYDISGLVSADPTNAEISAAFHQKYPNIPIQPGIRVADYNNAHFWQYGNNMWILLTQINIQTATNESLGTVKGSNTDGKVFVETDGSMSLKGYDALVSKDATHDSKISTLETGLGNANARIDATNTNVANNAADIIAANGNINTNTNDITSLKGRMATAEGQIATHETTINQHTQSINGLTTDVNGLKTNKQDKLTAGENITIVGNVISAEGGVTYVAGEGINIEGNVISATNTSVPIYSPLIVGSARADSGGSGAQVECDVASFGTGAKSNGSYSLPYSTTKQTLNGINNVPQLDASTLNAQLDFSSLNIPNKHVSYSLILIDSANNVIDRLNGQGVLDATSKISVTLNQVSWFKLGSSNRNLSIAATNVIWS